MADASEYFAGVEWRGELLCEAFVGKEKKSRGIIGPPLSSKGVEGMWNPEEMLVVSLASCSLITYMYFVIKNGISIKKYSNSVKGELEKGKDGWAFIKYKIRINVVAEKGHKEKAEETIHLAERFCLVANSLSGERELEYEVTEE